MNRYVKAAIVVVSLVLPGCGGGTDPNIAPVEGTVTLDGKPVPYATVLFFTGAGRPAAGRTDEQGRYTLALDATRKGAMIGKNSVRITTVHDGGETAEGKKIPSSGEKLPARYNALTELQFVVEAGKTNVADFALDSSGPLPSQLEEEEPADEVADEADEAKTEEGKDAEAKADDGEADDGEESVVEEVAPSADAEGDDEAEEGAEEGAEEASKEQG